MPDWITYKDRDGNIFYLDKNGKIYTEGDPEFKYKSISVDGIDYYIVQAENLYKRFHKIESLYIFKSILFLSDMDKSVETYGMRAASWISEIKKREGDRFPGLDLNSSLILVKNKEWSWLYNSEFKYYFKIKGEISILKRFIKRGHGSYLQYGIMVGVRTADNKSEKSSFDFVVTIYSEEFPYKIFNVDKYEEIFTKRGLKYNYLRKLLKKSLTNKIYKIENINIKNIQGYEEFRVSQKKCYHFRFFANKDKYLEKRWNGFKKNFTISE